MSIEEQVCSLELAKKLKELGVKQENVFWWGNLGGIVPDKRVLWRLAQGGIEAEREGEWFAPFTVAELGEMMPLNFVYNGKRYFLGIDTSSTSGNTDNKE